MKMIFPERVRSRRRIAGTALALFTLVVGPRSLPAQTAGQEPYTLKRAVEEAWQKYPTISAARAATEAASARVRVAQDAYLPQTSVHMQWTRATRNNVLGMMIPNQTIAPISGLVPNGITGDSTFGTAMGALLSWTAYDFGSRRAHIQAAEANRTEAEAQVALARYRIADAVADAFFRAVAAEQVEAAAAASVTRWKATLTAVEALANAGLRPGADVSRVRADLSRAEAEQLLARQQARQASVSMAQYLTEPEKPIAPEASWALQPFGAASAPETGEGVHPVLAIRQAAIASRTAESKAIRSSWYPTIDLFSAGYGRGTGARIDGTFRGGAAGLYPDTGNWAVGVGVTVDLFDWKRSRTRREVTDFTVSEARARQQETSMELRTLVEQARVGLEGARAIAAKTPETLAAARELLTQSDVRYRTGLGTITDLAEAQRSLRQAEIDDAIAKLNVWRAAWGLSAARGELESFLNRLQ